MKRLILLFCCSFLLSQQNINLPLKKDGVVYNASIPVPELVIGHKIGTRHTRPHQVVDYFEAVAAASDRVILEDHGFTHEGRRLIHAIVTHPKNQAKLEQIRRRNLKLSNRPHTIKDSDLEKMPLIAYLGFSVHGDEASGTEAAILLLHHLASGSGKGVDDVLENCIIIIDPMFNPDGRARFVNWVNGNRGSVATADFQDREHNQPWPRGRTNHYLFDLNRDWMPVTQPESEGRVKLFHHWRPQFLLDVHEMGKNATFFFQPGIPSRNNPNTPLKVFELTEKLAKYHAKELDRIGSLYYSKESFDDFYYGKGSTFGDIHGSVGILFEQASSRALQTDTETGLLTYAFTIRNQFLAALGNVAGLTALRKEFLTYQRDFYASAEKAYLKYSVKGYLINIKDNRTRAQLLLKNLQKHRVKIHALEKKYSIKDKKFLPGEAVVVSLNQPQTRFIKSVMERVTTFQDSLFYDVSTWTLPLAYGVETIELRHNPRSIMGKQLKPVILDGGSVIGGRATIAYLMEWGRYFSPRALNRILEAGFSPRLSKEPFSVMVDGKEHLFDRGTIIIPVIQRDANSQLTTRELDSLVNTIAREDHVNIFAANTGLTPQGPDLGSRFQPILKKPKIALLSGVGTTAYDVGEAWHLLNERMGIPVSLVEAFRLSNKDLSEYNTIVMVRGSYSRLDSADIKALKGWVKKGGTLIATARASKWVIDKKIINEKMSKSPKDTLQVAYANVSSTTGAQRIGGAIFQVAIDNTHPIAFGYGEKAAVFRYDKNFYEPSVITGANVAKYTDTPLLSGYISQRNLERIRGTASIIARRQGKGHVILFADNPNFRAFWYGTNGLFLNAVFFGQIF